MEQHYHQIVGVGQFQNNVVYRGNYTIIPGLLFEQTHHHFVFLIEEQSLMPVEKENSNNKTDYCKESPLVH